MAANNAHVFHNRLTHSIQVAQVGQSIAESLLEEDANLASDLGGLDSDVVQAACLAHDLGHPPFGHAGEQELNKLALGHGLTDGFEGNAQSFRVVTKLAFRSLDYPGLNLSRATLAAILKYPWLREAQGKKRIKSKKWGAYLSERDDFQWACELLPAPEIRTLEAEIMNWSDDVSYAVYDMEDFYRAGRIPLHMLSDRKSEAERNSFYQKAFERHVDDDEEGSVWRKYSREQLEVGFTNTIVLTCNLQHAFLGTREDRSRLREFTAGYIHKFIGGIKLSKKQGGADSCVEIEPSIAQEVAMLKELTRHYVIDNPALATQQHGQRRIIRELFLCFLKAVRTGNLEVFPAYYKEKVEDTGDKNEKTRLVVDLIAGMAERQCVELHQRLTGASLPPSFDTFL